MTLPVISLREVTRSFPAGEEDIQVLKGIDLDIYPGELVAIVGASGSGKSTLMNIVGCLDQPTSGTFSFAGRDVSTLDPDELAELRREHFGFIFQRYQLLPDLSALENVEVPAIYAGVTGDARQSRAHQLLERLGLGDRETHRPNELSGGQQQRVSVARALINGGEVILADEPTGALDSRSGAELIELLFELHNEGHTIILVTHDPALAQKADRTIEISDGEIISDTGTSVAQTDTSPKRGLDAPLQGAMFAMAGRFAEAMRMALRAMLSHRLRTFLTMLGIIIGIASVVGMVALGEGTQQTVLDRISSIGTNTINVYPGTGFGDMRSGAVRTLTPADSDALAAEAFADSVSPTVSTQVTAVYKNTSASASVSGVGPDYFQVSGTEILSGQIFDDEAVSVRAQQAVIDENTVDTLFPNGGDPLGEVIMLGNVPVRIIGVAEASSGFGPNSSSLNIWIPYTSAMTRMLGQTYLSQITVRVADDYDMDQAEAEIEAVMAARHGTTDFFLQNTNTIRETITETSQTLSLLISMIAVISLIVGGIGVMNIMLVSVSERTKEIGVRMAVGARRSDIMQQFLIEAVLVCIVGGTVGVALALGIGQTVQALSDVIVLTYSPWTVVAAFLSATLIGVVFGFMPARSAAQLNPVEALSRE